MATLAPIPDAERFHIVLAPEEKRRWTNNAAAAGLPTSEYVRRAVDAYEHEERLTPHQMRGLEMLVAEAVAAVHRMRADIDEMHAIIARPYDSEDAFEAGVAAGKASGFKLDFSHLARSEAA